MQRIFPLATLTTETAPNFLSGNNHETFKSNPDLISGNIHRRASNPEILKHA